MVLQTEEGKCVGAATEVVRGSSDTLEGEVLGLQAALNLARTHTEAPIMVGMDSLSIVEAVKNRKVCRRYWGCVVRWCGDFIHKNPNINIY
jgi:hypothetical protein